MADKNGITWINKKNDLGNGRGVPPLRGVLFFSWFH